MADYMPFSALNPADKNQPVVFVGIAATLNLSINNATGSDIQLQAGTSASLMQISLPYYYTQAEIQAMSISNISQPGWTGGYDSSNVILTLTYTGTAAPWTNSSSLTFDINNMTSNNASTMDTLVISFKNITGTNVQSGVQQNLSLNNPPPPVNTDITKVLQVNVDNQGSVFVSVAADPLNNTIYLNLKNIGTDPLYNDSVMWQGNPVVNVSFVYGNTAGALAPDVKTTPTSLGSAWLIGASVYTNQNWGCTNLADNQANSPVWKLYPNPTNKDILGTGADANVTFAFSNIASFTPAGHTQMYVQITNFMANSTTYYVTANYVIDIVKQVAPPTRGLISFFSTGGSIIPLQAPQANIQIPLRWSSYYVDNVNMICNIPGVQLMTKNYYSSTMPPLNYDTYSLVIPVKISQNTPIFITLQAFDNTGAYLNAMQFTVFIAASFYTDPAGQVYPVLFINNQNWLGANYNYNSGSGCVYYDNNSGYQEPYGMLYNGAAAQANIPSGWHLPTQTEWQNLINAVGPNAYQALMADGSSNFNAQLGGYSDNQGNFNNMGGFGYYWASTTDPTNPGNDFFAQFYAAMNSVSTANSFSTSNYLSVRYVQNS